MMTKRPWLQNGIFSFALLAVCGLAACDPGQTGDLAAKPDDEKAAIQIEESPSKVLEDKKTPSDSVLLGGGCFWCVEAVFEELEGVTDVVSGYAGGHVKNPSYRAVCTGETGHVEVCEIKYDPKKVTFEELLAVFFKTHDPTTMDAQGPDHGSQYRSAVMYTTDAQKEAAETYIKKLDSSGEFSNKIVTVVQKSGKFYPAGKEHQNYFAEHPSAGYCRAIITPKIRKFRDLFPEKRKKK